jgi:long-chain acyl-CoA synthetase
MIEADRDPADNVAALFARMDGLGKTQALYYRGCEVGHDGLLDRAQRWQQLLGAKGVGPGKVCAFLGDYGPGTVSLLLAIVRLGAVAMPLTASAKPNLSELLSIAGAEWLVQFGDGGDFAGAKVEVISGTSRNPLVERFQAAGHPGLIVFTSGSSGRPKGILHDFEKILAKFSVTRPGWRTVLFLMMDHFGGINTLLSCVCYDGLGVCVPQRTPDAVCRSIAAASANLLPTTPTFLNMLLASEAWRHHDLSSLRMISYGAEPMPDATLRRVSEIFPQAQLKQTYGLSELGVLRSNSADRQSLWLRVGGAGFATRIVDNVLHVRSVSNMVGYLNAPNPIDEDGWMNTGDVVEERDGMIRFLGRVSEIINVGGQKVFPAEVESVLLDAPRVIEATVYGRHHPLLGQAVCARVSLEGEEDSESAAYRLRRYCSSRLAKFKVPMHIETIQLASQSNERSKKNRAIRE